MRRLIVTAGLALCALLLDGGAKPAAECSMCKRGDCWSSDMCFEGCACLKQGRERRGVCVSFDALPEGAELLE